MGGRRVLAAMSGGVDSSVAALLLLKEGFEVEGVTMCIAGGEENGGKSCCAPRDIVDARGVCRLLGIPHNEVRMGEELEKRVIAPSIREYAKGRTPNPCVICNARVKFGSLMRMMSASENDMIATGHYARIVRRHGRPALARSVDESKDQTYFLYAVPRSVLERVLFPVGGMTKDRVRALAEEAGLPVMGKRESQDICFLHGEGWDEFYRRRGVKDEPGEIVSAGGEKLGRHRGVFRYTIGQRRGLGVSAPHPLYVISIDAASNRLVVGGEEELYSTTLLAEPRGFLAEDVEGRADAKIRYAHKAQPCQYHLEGGTLEVRFDEQQRAITPGQSVVLYDGEVVLGGGVIMKAQ